MHACLVLAPTNYKADCLYPFSCYKKKKQRCTKSGCCTTGLTILATSIGARARYIDFAKSGFCTNIPFSDISDMPNNPYKISHLTANLMLRRLLLGLLSGTLLITHVGVTERAFSVSVSLYSCFHFTLWCFFTCSYWGPKCLGYALQGFHYALISFF